MVAERAGSQAPADVREDLVAPQVRPSVDEDRAVARTRARGARDKSEQLRERVHEAQEEARRAADVAISAMAEADGLRRAMDSRAQIEMAKGILIERHKITPDGAFQMLVGASQRGQVKLIDVARALVEQAAGPA